MRFCGTLLFTPGAAMIPLAGSAYTCIRHAPEASTPRGSSAGT